MILKSFLSRVLLAAFAVSIISNVYFAESAPMGLPDKYKVILDKKWVLTKFTVNGKDNTAEYLKSLKGLEIYYIYKNDGTVETNNPDLLNSTWKYEGGYFKIFTKGSPEKGTANGTVNYTIGAATDKIFQLDLKPIKMSMIYSAK
jgi:hypothetical protein